MTGLAAANVYLGDEAAHALSVLDRSPEPKAKSIARRARALRAILLADCLHAEVLRKSAIPPQLARRHHVENLCVEDLPDLWRLLYTLTRRNGKPYVVVLEIVDDPTYSRWFPGGRG